MEKWKSRAAILAVCLCGAVLTAAFFLRRDWTVRFRGELDAFFGEGRWEAVSQEEKESIIYEEYLPSASNPSGGTTVPGQFHEWLIRYTDGQGENALWTLSDHTYRINRDRYSILSPRRYSAKEAFVLELMNLTCGTAGDAALREAAEGLLSETEMGCLKAEISYEGGNPSPEFYDGLWEEPWFRLEDAAAEQYLSSELHDFYLDIRVHDYRLEKLTEEERRHVLDSLEPLTQRLLERYGENASFSIYLDGEHRAEYRNGIPAEH